MTIYERVFGIVIACLAMYYVIRMCWQAAYKTRTTPVKNKTVTYEPWRRVTVSMDAIGAYAPPEYEYEGLDFDINHFPEQLARFVKYNGRENLARYMLLVNSNKLGAKERNDMCRAITIAAAVNATTIPYQLVLIDNRTQALAHALVRDLEEESVARPRIFTDAANNLAVKGHAFDFVLSEMQSPFQIQRRENILNTYMPNLQIVGELIMEFYLHENFPTFLNFAKRLEKKKLSDADIRSIATAFAGITGIKIPRSYIRYDALSILLMNADIQPLQPALTLVK